MIDLNPLVAFFRSFCSHLRAHAHRRVVAVRRVVHDPRPVNELGRNRRGAVHLFHAHGRLREVLSVQVRNLVFARRCRSRRRGGEAARSAACVVNVNMRVRADAAVVRIES